MRVREGDSLSSRTTAGTKWSPKLTLRTGSEHGSFPEVVSTRVIRTLFFKTELVRVARNYFVDVDVFVLADAFRSCARRRASVVSDAGTSASLTRTIKFTWVLLRVASAFCEPRMDGFVEVSGAVGQVGRQPPRTSTSEM